MYSDYYYCQDYYGDFTNKSYAFPALGETVTEEHTAYIEALHLGMVCSNARSNLYMSFLVIVLGVAFLAGGYITRDSER